MPSRRELLRQSIELLAAEPPVQIEFLESSPVRAEPDELALQFDDRGAAVGDMLAQREISDDEVAAVHTVRASLDAIDNDDAALWTREALLASDEWARVRRVARECLGVLR